MAVLAVRGAAPGAAPSFTPNAAQARRVRLIPTSAAALFSLLALIVPIELSAQLLNSDGDLARHLRVGAYILARRSLFYADPFSYTKFGQPFVPYEWLSEVIYALANQLAGLAGVAVLAGLIIAGTYALVTGLLAARGVDPLLALGTGVLAAVAGSIHWLARPHLFTALGSVLLIWILERPGQRRVWPVVPLFILWANLHGGFLFGLIVLAVYLVGDLAESRICTADERTVWHQRARFDAAALILAFLAALVNPVGPRLFQHVTAYLGDRYLVDWTNEYQTPSFHALGAQYFLGVLLLVMTAFALARRRPSLPHLFLVLATTAFALYSARNIPLFCVTAFPVVILEFDATWRSLLAGPLAPARLIAGISRRLAVGEQYGSRGTWPSLVTAGLIVLAAAGGKVADVPVINARFLPERFPVAAVEKARAAHLTGRLFSEFTWGGYLLYAWPEQKVFIDGQTDFYGDDLTRTYTRIMSLDPGWRDDLDRWKVSLVIIPDDWRLAAALRQEPGWSVWYEDRTAIILRRNG